jgi:hypothetical protein
MNGISGFQQAAEQYARETGGKSKTHGSSLEIQKTQNFRTLTSHHAYRFLRKQQHQLATDARHLLHTHELMARFTVISTKRV